MHQVFCIAELCCFFACCFPALLSFTFRLLWDSLSNCTMPTSDLSEAGRWNWTAASLPTISTNHPGQAAQSTQIQWSLAILCDERSLRACEASANPSLPASNYLPHFWGRRGRHPARLGCRTRGGCRGPLQLRGPPRRGPHCCCCTRAAVRGCARRGAAACAAGRSVLRGAQRRRGVGVHACFDKDRS